MVNLISSANNEDDSNRTLPLSKAAKKFKKYIHQNTIASTTTFLQIFCEIMTKYLFRKEIVDVLDNESAGNFRMKPVMDQSISMGKLIRQHKGACTD